LGRSESVIEFGANVGMNLRAIKMLFPNTQLAGIEINESAAKELSVLIGEENVVNDSILNFNTDKKFDVTLIKGVLIHINPDMLPMVYEKLCQASSKYILVCEYYNPTPISVNYRGNEGFLFKRDFAGDLLDTYSDLRIVDYGFCYRRDKALPQDDITWFLLEKQ
jgi:pseudaminic acid biosynthesis-associated methylase